MFKDILRNFLLSQKQSPYLDKRFLGKLNANINIIFEVGARYGTESIKLSKMFPNSQIYSFECNPNTLQICEKNLKDRKNIHFMAYGLGNENHDLPFYSYTKGNDGASSFFKRVDAEETQKITGFMKTKKLVDVMKELSISHIDLLCMDVQGYELNVLIGAGEQLKNVKYIIMEEPKSIINEKFLDKGLYSQYINAPSSLDIKNFMTKNDFVEIGRIEENKIEDNVMYKNKLLV